MSLPLLSPDDDLGADDAEVAGPMPAASAPAVSAPNSMSTVEWLDLFWPLTGIYVITTLRTGKAKKRGKRKKVMYATGWSTIKEAADEVIEKREKYDTYFGIFTSKRMVPLEFESGGSIMIPDRSADGAAFTRLFPLDFDVGESEPGKPKYATREDALRDLKRLLDTTAWPKPFVTSSGNGFHVFWVIGEDIDRATWQPLADLLKYVCEQLNIIVDPVVTADAARVLRPIWTWNYKEPTNRKRVELVKRGRVMTLAEWGGGLRAFAATLPPMIATTRKAASGIILPEGAAASAPETPGNVAIVEAMLAAISPDVGRGLWMKVLWAVAALGWDCGKALARAWSEPGATWDEGEFASVWDSFVPGRGIGPGSLVHVAREHGYAGAGLAAGGSVGLAGSTGSLSSETGASGLPGAVDATSSPDATGDIANAERLAAALRGAWLWIEDEGVWVRFSLEAGWLKAAEAEALNVAVTAATDMRRRAREALAEAAHDDAGARKVLQNIERTHRLRDLKAAVEIAKAMPGLWARRADFDADPWLLGVRNGVLNLRTGRLQPFAPELRVSKRAAVDFDPAADCPLWRAFLARVLPDGDVRAFLRRWAGYLLTGDVGAHKWAFLFGSGANGKSVFTETLAHLLGDYAHPLATEVLMDDPRGGRNHDPDIMALQGKRLASATETEEGQRLASARVKRLTGGDTLSGRRPYDRAPGSFTPTHKLMLSGNHRPAISDASPGTWRRVAAIEFGVEIPEPERDPDLPTKLRGEVAGILNWALAGLADFRAGGLQLPAAVTAATDEYQRDEDVFGQFLTERCELGDGFKVAGATLYGAFGGWCTDNGRRQVPTKNWLTRQLKGRRVTVGRDRDTYLGIRLARHLGGPFPVE